MAQISVHHKWQQGDVLVFDNVAAQHGRRPWVGVQSDRIVHASLWDGAVPLPYGGHEWERLVKPVN
jgi:alpha-ketoglutarate-dependent taurine dioxygenase